MNRIDTTKRVLIVTYVFPPMAAVGGQRIVNFCKFLPRYGWRPVVLTVKNGVNTSWDSTPLKSIPETIIYRSRTFEPILRREIKQAKDREKYIPAPYGVTQDKMQSAEISFLKRIKRFLRMLLTVPDHAIFWIPFGFLKGLKAIRREKISVIMSSSPPVSTHILASLLSRWTGIPHLVDFRDLWTLNQNYDQRGYTPFFKKYDRFWEQFVFKKADRLMTASPGFTSELNDYIPNPPGGEIVTITNGFDYGEVDLEREFEIQDSGKFKILHTGSLYGQFNPIFFLESLALWLNSNPELKDSVRVEFIGNSDYDYSAWVEQLGLKEVVKFRGYIPRAELIPQLQQADYLLLLIGFRKEAASVMPAKMYEYLASGTKILALAPLGPAVEWITKYSAGTCITEPDKEKMVKLLQERYKQWQSGHSEKRKYRYIEEIDRAKLAGRLANLLEETAQVRGKRISR